MKKILILSVLTLIFSISISISQPNKGIHSHQEPPKKSLYSVKEKKCKFYEKKICNNGKCDCIKKITYATSDKREKYKNKSSVLTSGNFSCAPGYIKCYIEHFKIYKCFPKSQFLFCQSGPRKKKN